MIEAVIVDPTSSQRLVIGAAPAPQLIPNQALVRVHAFSINRGEVRRSLIAPAGHRPGWDFAGVVEQAAADNSGPPVGTRVVGLLNSGAWATHVAAPTQSIAVLPDQVTYTDAATLPVAGLTALHALYKGGFLLGRSVLITGATGGVGDFACQLAHQGGAHVVATVRWPDRQDFVKSLGVDHVIVGDDPTGAAQFGPYPLIIDSVGGPQFGKILAMLARRGTCVIFGTTAGAEPTIHSDKFYSSGPVTLYGMILFQELLTEPAGIGLKILVELLADGKLEPHIQVEDSWRNVAEVTQHLIDRKFAGKAVLTVD